MSNEYQIQFAGANGKFKLLSGKYALALATPDDSNVWSAKTEKAAETNIAKSGDSVTIIEKTTTVKTKSTTVLLSQQAGMIARVASSMHRAIVTADPRTVTKNVSTLQG